MQKAPPLPTRDEVRAHAIERGLLGPDDPLPNDLFKKLARELHDEAKALARRGPDLGSEQKRLASRVLHDAGDHWVVVEVSTVPKS